jgi:hypothetical protein
MNEIISKLTRIAFQDSYAHNSTLYKISKSFDEAGVMQTDIPDDRVIYGERRRLLEQYYCSVDWTSSKDVRKVLKAYEEHLIKLFRENQMDEYQKLIKCLEDDGLHYSGGTIDLPTEQTPKIDSSEEKITVTELGNIRREINRLMDLAEGRRNSNITPGKRILQLRDQNIIPHNIASLMLTIIGLRNVAEYQRHELTQSETQVVKNAWSGIREWARGNGWECKQVALFVNA